MSDCIDRGLDAVRADQEPLRAYVKDIAEFVATLEPATQCCAERQQKFEALRDRVARTKAPIFQKMAHVSFAAGLFVGEDTSATINDNWIWSAGFAFRRVTSVASTPIATRGYASSWRGPLVHALDAHVAHPEPFTVEELMPYRTTDEPSCHTEALHRRKIMRKARSKKKRPILPADLERRCRESPKS